MAKKHSFQASIEDAGGGGAYVRVPFDVEAAFGKKRVKVRATIDGEPYRSTLMRMGGSDHVLGVLKALREKLGKGIGDTVKVTLEEDLEPRVVELPDDFRKALAKRKGAKAAFEKLSYTNQREMVAAIMQAKRAETRTNRIAAALEKLVPR